MSEREQQQASVRSALAAHEYAVDEQRKAQNSFDVAVKSTRTTGATEVAKAEAALQSAANAKLTEASKSGCKTVCNEMLTATQSAARNDLDAARRRAAADLETTDPSIVSAKAELAIARQRANSNPRPEVSGSALGDRLGWPPWALDLVVAALLSVAANGMGASLVAFGSHMHLEGEGAGAAHSAAPQLPFAPTSRIQPADTKKVALSTQAKKPEPTNLRVVGGTEAVKVAVNPSSQTQQSQGSQKGQSQRG